MFWVEGTVSVHKENELKLDHAVSYESLRVGDDASCRFKKTYYEGKIAGVGKEVWFSPAILYYSVHSNKGNRADMLALEKDFIDGRYTPFEEQIGNFLIILFAI